MQRKQNKSPRLILFLSLFFAVLSVATASTLMLTAKDARFLSPQGEALLKTSAKEGVFCPGGMSFGVRLSTKGVLVVGFSRGKEMKCPAEEAGLAVKDVIEKVNGKSVNTAAEVIAAIESCGGKPVTLSLIHAEKAKEITFTPSKDEAGVYKAGIWVRDSTAGIGTVTLVDPASGYFLGLGHGICDTDTGVLMPLLKGNVYDISVVAVRKGQVGTPGELKGYFSPSLSGILMKNTATGVMGRYSAVSERRLPEPMPLGSREEVKVGKASIYTTLTDGVTREYSVRIAKITDPDGEAKNFVLEVDDPRLLEETGGIVQGMSGSPVIQNGKIVGAVTHVMVNDPTRGYGIFIENMLKAADMPLEDPA